MSTSFVAVAYRLAGGHSSVQHAHPTWSDADAPYRTDNMRSMVRLLQVKAQTGLSRSTIYQRIKDGAFPKPISLGPRAVGWLQSDIETFIDERVAASRNEVTQ